MQEIHRIPMVAKRILVVAYKISLTLFQTLLFYFSFDMIFLYQLSMESQCVCFLDICQLFSRYNFSVYTNMFDYNRVSCSESPIIFTCKICEHSMAKDHEDMSKTNHAYTNYAHSCTQRKYNMKFLLRLQIENHSPYLTVVRCQEPFMRFTKITNQCRSSTGY